MGVVVLMADQDAFACSAHAMLLVVFFEALQSRKYRWVLFWLSVFCAKGVVAQRVQADGLGLVGVEILG
jgi:uncharacterized membrane-anchored protein